MKTRILLLGATLGLVASSACAPKKAPEPAAAPTPPPPDTSWRNQTPAPLAPRPFAIPEAERGTLSNGLPVIVVHNDEVPLVYVTLAFRDGAWTDPANRPGLAAAAMDLMNEGAGDLDAEALSKALKKVAANLGTSAGPDGASVGLTALKSELGPSLDLMTLVLTKPTMADKEWELLRKQRLADLATELEDPSAISRRVFWRVMMGNGYLGNFTTEASLKAMKTAELKGWVSTHLRPDRAVALVGGDITLAEIQPMLEERLGSWKPKATLVPTQPTATVIRQPEKTTIYLVDKPGSSQSVLRVGRPVGPRTDPSETAFDMANDAVGGMFTARVNLNLREDKGYTYGARSWTFHSYVPDIWILSTSVRADATAASLTEIMKEVRGASGDRPLSQDELDKAKGNALGTFPVEYETPGDLLNGLSEIWRYGLPSDWLKTTPDRVRAVTLDVANASWKKQVDPEKLDIIVVGDAASIREGISGLGIPVVELNRDGERINGK